MTKQPDPLRAALEAVADACPKAIDECMYFATKSDDADDARRLRTALDVLQGHLSEARAALHRAGHGPGDPGAH